MATLQHVLAQGRSMLRHGGRDVGRLDAQLLLEYALSIDRSILYAFPEREVTVGQEQEFYRLIERRIQGEPLAYIVGHEEFYGHDFFVNARVLIPRPETELLVEDALRIVRAQLAIGQTPLVADIGTGSGVIPITLALEESRLRTLYAVDISPEALAVAQQNCIHQQVMSQVQLLQGNLLEPLPEPVDLLTANLPYVGTDEVDVMTRDVLDYEPHLALFSGPDGLDLIRRFFEQVLTSEKLKPRGTMLLEIGYRQREPLTALLTEKMPDATITFQKDYAGWDRVLQVTL